MVTAKIADLNVTLGKLAAAVAQALVPAGAVLPYGGTSAPSGFLLCDGSAVSRSTYAALFAVTGVAHGSGDGVTTFNVPDYRGRFLRGLDGGAGNDPDRASRTAMNTGGNTGDTIGSLQADGFASHNHVSNNVGNGNTGQFGTSAFTGGLGTFTATVVNLGSITSSTGGNETRPKNATVNFIIKT